MKNTLKRIIINSVLITSLAGGIGCDDKENRDKPLDKISGVPKFPNVNLTYHGEDASFILNLVDGKEVLCSYHGYNHRKEINEIGAVIIDAYQINNKFLFPEG